MTIQVELWALVTFLAGLAITIVSGIVGAARYSLTQSEHRQDERHKASEKARIERAKHWDERFAALERAAHEEYGQWRRVERELLTLKADLPLNYVRREDYIQAVATIMAKLDAMSLRFENILLKGQRNEP